MKYISVKEAAQKWGVSGTLVRRYCKEGRIPKAIQKETGWKIPENAKKPGNEITSGPTVKTELPALAKKLQNQKKKKNYHGLYDYVQINLTYSSSRMASNRLTRQHVDSIFRKGKVGNMFEPMKVSDMIEVMNHCVCIDYILEHLSDPLSPNFIKHIHSMLTYGTVDSRLSRVSPGEYRNSSSLRKESFIYPSSTIATSLKMLTTKYESNGGKTLTDILEFHVQFGRIFPFEDYNGRIGRLIMFKECLRHNVMPFILDDKRRSQYLDGLRDWDTEHETLVSVVNEAQSRFDHQINQHILLAQGKRFLPKNFDDEDAE